LYIKGGLAGELEGRAGGAYCPPALPSKKVRKKDFELISGSNVLVRAGNFFLSAIV
jgi:hypothetical protein